MKSYNKIMFILVAFIFCVFMVPQTHAAQFNQGDIFAAVANGEVYHYAVDGTFIESLNIGAGGFTTGMAFDASGNLYVTGFSANIVAKFDNQGNLLGTFGSGYSTPESIVFDNAGNAYVGNLGNGIRKYDSAGNFLATIINTRVDFLDLAADQTTMLYTQEGNSIKTVDVTTGVSGPDFTTGTATQAFALRILPDGGVLLADRINVKRYNASGVVIQTYDVAGEDTWFSLNLDPDGTSFWSGNFGTGIAYKFDIASGSVLQTLNTGVGGNRLYGLAIFGEITAAVNNPPVCQINPPGPFTVDEGQALSFDVSGSDPNAGDEVTLSTLGLPTGASMNPPLPLTGPNTGVTSTFNWTPSPGQAGNYSLTFIATDTSGAADTCVVDITVNPTGIVDNTPPSCELTGVNPGPPLSIEITIQDGESGLQSISVAQINNATVNIPAFTPGTTTPVIVTAAKINNNQSAFLALEVTDVAGNSTICDPVYTTLSSVAPDGYALEPNYPNPFNPTTTIHFNIAASNTGAQSVTLRIYDLSGQEVKTLINESMQPGQYAVEWDGTNNRGEVVAGGVYLYRLVAGNFVATRKMIFMK